MEKSRADQGRGACSLQSTVCSSQGLFLGKTLSNIYTQSSIYMDLSQNFKSSFYLKLIINSSRNDRKLTWKVLSRKSIIDKNL